MQTAPWFGFISGAATTIGFLPHILILTVVLLRGEAQYATPYIIFAFAAKELGEWLFWDHFFDAKIERNTSLKNWRTFIDHTFMQPAVFTSLLNMLCDLIVDGLLMYMALKTSIPPVGLCLMCVACQVLTAPIHRIISDPVIIRKSMLFSLLITAFAVILSSEITSRDKLAPSINLLGFDHVLVSTQMLIILCAKGLLANTTIIAKAAIADCILDKAQALKSSSTEIKALWTLLRRMCYKTFPKNA